MKRDEIEENIWIDSKGRIVVDSRLKAYEEIIPFIEDNLCYEVDEDGECSEGINWENVWRDVDKHNLKIKLNN